MKITIKGNEYGMGFYGDGKPLFWHKDGHSTLTLLELLVNELHAISIEYIGEIDDAGMERDFA